MRAVSIVLARILAPFNDKKHKKKKHKKDKR